ncbi:MAG: CAP domain-containing protein [Patescibacteria group bacterium]
MFKGKAFLPILVLFAVSLPVVLAYFIFPSGYDWGRTALIFKTHSLASVLPGVVVALTNTDRVRNNVSLLVLNPLLTKAAQMKADDMLARQYYSHTTPEGNTPLYFLDAVGYTYLNVGENLDLTYVSTADDVHTAWMNSPSHRANLLLPQFTEIGVGVAEGEYQGNHVSFVVEILATPRPPALPAILTAPASIPTPQPQPTSTPTLTQKPTSTPKKQETKKFTPVIPVSSPVSVQTPLETFVSTSTEALPPVLERVLAKNASSSSSTPNLVLSASSTESAVELLTLFGQSENPLQASLRSFVRSFKVMTQELLLRIYFGASFRDQQRSVLR